MGTRRKNMDNRLVTVARIFNPVLAEEFATQLKLAGIKCFIFDEHMAMMYAPMISGTGGIRVKVAESDAEFALEIFEEFQKNSMKEPESSDDEEDEDREVKPMSPVTGWILTIILFITLMGLIILFSTLLSR